MLGFGQSPKVERASCWEEPRWFSSFSPRRSGFLQHTVLVRWHLQHTALFCPSSFHVFMEVTQEGGVLQLPLLSVFILQSWKSILSKNSIFFQAIASKCTVDCWFFFLFCWFALFISGNSSKLHFVNCIYIFISATKKVYVGFLSILVAFIALIRKMHGFCL